MGQSPDFLQDTAALPARPLGGKSPGWAVALSALGTALPLAAASLVSRSSDASSPNQRTLLPVLLTTGFVLGPSLGQFYAQAPGRAFVS